MGQAHREPYPGKTDEKDVVIARLLCSQARV
jgi:hypothetical protein